MKLLEIAKQILEEAGYKVTPPEDKFTPYKGQLVEAEDEDVWYVMCFVSSDTRGRHICSSRHDLLYGIPLDKIRPLSNKYIKQFKPWSERGEYNGPANVLFDSNKIMFFATVAAVELMGNPIAFEPQESKE